MDLFLIISVLIALLVLKYYYKDVKEYFRYRNLVYKLPLAENDLFILGHAFDLVGSEEGMFKTLRRWNSGKKHLYIARVGPYVALNVLDPDVIEILTSNTKHLDKSLLYNLLTAWLGSGLLTSTGNMWQNRRKILTPAFHFSILKGFVGIFNEGADQLITRIKNHNLNAPIDVMPLVSDTTLQGINGTSMGTKLDEVDGGVKYQKNISEVSAFVSWRSVRPWWFNNIAYNFLSEKGKKEWTLVREIHKFVDSVIKKRATNFKTFDVPSVASDEDFEYKKHKLAMLDLLLNDKIKNNSISDQGIRDEVNTFMFEGHDTTAVNLAFTLMLLACHKEIQDEVYEEITQILGPDVNKLPSFTDLQEMNLMERCIKESLRLYPSVPLIGRVISNDTETKYGILPKGLSVHIHIYDLHRIPKYWPDPEKFDPSRFLPENSRDRHPFAYIPFSAGPRNCIGQRFALLELKSIICGILKNFILEPVDTPKTIVLVQDMLLRAKQGVKVKFVPRHK